MATDSIETRRTTCSRDCPDACGMLADVRDGEVVALRGDPEHPVTQGFLCSRTSNFHRVHRGPDRLLSAFERRDGVLRAVEDLDAVLDHVAERLQAIRDESGPEAIFHYRSGGSLGLLKSVADRFFEDFGPCTTKIGDICSGAGEAAQEADFGVADSNDLFDLRDNSAHIVIWGKNPFVSQVHLVPVLKAAGARGATITMIDPVHHKGAGLADNVLQPRPGGDLALAFAVARGLIDEGLSGGRSVDWSTCSNAAEFRALVERDTVAGWAARADVPLAAVELLTQRFAEGPTSVLVGWGMQRRSHGAAIVRAIDALVAISGNLYRPGGGSSFYYARRAPFGDLTRNVEAPRRIREPMFGEDVLAARNPKIRALWVTAGNPVAMLPDAARVADAIESCEFVVVVDPFMTDTARRADVVLPCPTLLEDDDLIGAYGHHWIGESRPLIAPPPGVVHETEIFRRLASKLGMGETFDRDVESWKRELMRPLAEHGVTLETLREGRGSAVRAPTAKAVRFAADAMPTPSGKVELMAEAPMPRRATADPDYPLWLFSNSTRDAQSSQWSRDPDDRLPVRVHPDVAARAGLVEGDDAQLVSATGSLIARVVIDPLQRQDVAIYPKGGHYDRGQSANALIAAAPTDQGLGAAYLDCRVRLEKVS